MQRLLKSSIAIIVFLLASPTFANTQANNTVKDIKQEAHSADVKFKKKLKSVAPKGTSAYQKRFDKQLKDSNNFYGLMFYNPNYVLPVYYTQSPYQSVYAGQTPDNQKLKRYEFKAQLSFQFPIWQNILGPRSSMNIGYTQLMYWQFYAKSQYFRETNYMPELFVIDNPVKNWFFQAGVVHQSNGRGGSTERSWNRIYLNAMLSGKHWYVSFKPWLLIFKNESSDLHNPHITRYLGHGRIVLAYKFNDGQEISFMTRNNVESWFSRGAEELTYSFPIHGILHGYVQLFSGYGQSLIEYNHYTNGAGIGISLSNWL